MLSPDEIARYQRQMILPELGQEGQEKLKAARVLVVGAGGLGSPLLQYLAAAGVGTLGLVDFDVVEESNLHRQVLYSTTDAGKLKTEAAKERLRQTNPHVAVEIYNERLTAANALKIIANYDLVADGTDNFPTRYLVNDACVLAGKPNVFASIFQFDGQVSVFNLRNEKGEVGPNYRDVFPEPPAPGTVPSCAEGGVLGVLPGIIGSLQALETIKVITGMGAPLNGKLLLFNALTMQSRIIAIKRDPENPLNGLRPTQKELIDYEAFCGLTTPTNKVREILPADFLRLQARDEPFQLIDVREVWEYEAKNIGGLCLPLSELSRNFHAISREGKVVVYCQKGGRSARAIEILQTRHGYQNLFNLAGGIEAVLDES